MEYRKAITTELGRELLCNRCKEFWPADKEFWYSHHSWCKACYLEWRAERTKQKKAAKAEKVSVAA
jgi:hypothetical protein